MEMIAAAVSNMRNHCARASSTIRQERAAAWEEAMAASWRSKPGQVFRWCKGTVNGSATVLQRPGG
eukprot:8468797-Karenia_brevis.AAC.1